MNQIIEDFNDKVEEIERYLDLIKEAEKLSNGEYQGLERNSLVSLIENVELQKTLKANLFLLLYNLIESTLRSGVENIYDHLDQDGTHFNELNDLFKKKILNDAKNKINITDLHRATLVRLEKEIIRASFRPKEQFSGNIDRELVNKTGQTYGFSTSTAYAQTKHGEKLDTIKKNRNDLAHGNITFNEVGRTYSVAELEDTVKETVAYLDTILRNIKKYLDEEKFKKPTAV